MSLPQTMHMQQGRSLHLCAFWLSICLLTTAGARCCTAACSPSVDVAGQLQFSTECTMFASHTHVAWVVLYFRELFAHAHE